MAALAAVLAERGGRLGFNAKFLIEMGEETGSTGLRRALRRAQGGFAADVLIASDGPRVGPSGRPCSWARAARSISTSSCDLREGGHHSGNWGGLISNPGIILAHALACIVGPTGAAAGAGAGGAADAEGGQECLADVEIDGGEAGPQVDAWWGEPGLTPAERVYASNVFNILAFTTGTPGRPVNAIPPKAVANCQLRFVAGTDVGTASAGAAAPPRRTRASDS